MCYACPVSEPRLRVLSGIGDVPAAAWDALVAHDPDATPFVRWAFLDALEASGCASPASGWTPRHLTLWRGARLVAAAPAYAKADSEADFARDWHWAAFAQRAGFRYYPKLLVTVPITPVTGRRVLVGPGEDRAACTAALVRGALELCREERLSSLHVLFPRADEIPHLAAAGLARRVDAQAHWHNRGYRSYDEWLASLNAKKRRQARVERAGPAAQGITIRTVRGAEIAAEPLVWARLAHGFYHLTASRTFRPWLNQAFFERVFERLPEHAEVVVAHRAGRPIAAAFNVSTATHLYGRYWGCAEEHPYLHFNVCLYHSIDDCIQRGIQVFEGGAGGEHKVFRGFDVSPTWSAHAFLDPRLDQVIRDHLRLGQR